MTTLADIVTNMAKNQLSTATISQITRLSKSEVAELLSDSSYTPSDEEILDSSRRLALKIINEAFIMMDKGMPEVRMNVMRSFLPVMARMIGRVEDEKDEQLRSALEDMLAEQSKLHAVS